MPAVRGRRWRPASGASAGVASEGLRFASKPIGSPRQPRIATLFRDASGARGPHCDDGRAGRRFARVTHDLPPSPIAYAIPENDRVDGRVRRVLAGAGIALGAAGVAIPILHLTVALGLVSSTVVAGMARSGWQAAFQLSSVALDLLALIGGALLLRSDSLVARSLLRVGFGGKTALILASVAISFSSYPPSFTVADRTYYLLANVLSHVVIQAALFALTFALPPRRSA